MLIVELCSWITYFDNLCFVVSDACSSTATAATTVPATTVVSGPHNVPTSTLLHPGQVVSPAQQVKSSTPPTGQAGNNTPSSAGQPGDNTPKRLHVSNIPFRFRDPDLRNLFGVSATNFCYQLFKQTFTCLKVQQFSIQSRECRTQHMLFFGDSVFMLCMHLMQLHSWFLPQLL